MTPEAVMSDILLFVMFAINLWLTYNNHKCIEGLIEIEKIRQEAGQ